MSKMLPPDTLLQDGRYRIVRQLGLGAVSAIYEAQAEHLKIKVALKELLMDVPHLRDAFEQEARRLARLRHVTLPRVLDVFVENERCYFVMEYIEGQNLAQLLILRGRAFPVQDVLHWADLLLDALHYLHEQAPPVIHCDIKPSNIKLMPNGKIILLDFGLATSGLADESTAGHVYGYSLAYAPPEQLANRTVTAQSDLYALAATLYHLLTMQTPPDARMREQAIEEQQADPLLPANHFNTQVPVHIAQTLSQALSLKPTDRPANAAEMRDMLGLKPVSSPSAPLLSATNPKSKPKWRLWLPIAIAILLWIIIISGILTALMNNS